MCHSFDVYAPFRYTTGTPCHWALYSIIFDNLKDGIPAIFAPNFLSLVLARSLIPCKSPRMITEPFFLPSRFFAQPMQFLIEFSSAVVPNLADGLQCLLLSKFLSEPVIAHTQCSNLLGRHYLLGWLSVHYQHGSSGTDFTQINAENGSAL